MKPLTKPDQSLSLCYAIPRRTGRNNQLVTPSSPWNPPTLVHDNKFLRALSMSTLDELHAECIIYR